MKDIVDHIRTVHLSLMLLCFACVVALASIETESGPTRDELEEVMSIVKKWDPSWFDSYLARVFRIGLVQAPQVALLAVDTTADTLRVAFKGDPTLAQWHWLYGSRRDRARVRYTCPAMTPLTGSAGAQDEGSLEHTLCSVRLPSIKSLGEFKQFWSALDNTLDVFALRPDGFRQVRVIAIAIRRFPPDTTGPHKSDYPSELGTGQFEIQYPVPLPRLRVSAHDPGVSRSTPPPTDTCWLSALTGCQLSDSFPGSSLPDSILSEKACYLFGKAPQWLMLKVASQFKADLDSAERTELERREPSPENLRDRLTPAGHAEPTLLLKSGRRNKTYELAFIVKVPFAESTLTLHQAFSEVLQSPLNYGSFERRFRHLARVLSQFSAVRLAGLDSLVVETAGRAQEFRPFGIPVPGKGIVLWGSLVIVVIQSYLLIHLRALYSRLSTGVLQISGTWLGLYRDAFARWAAGVTSAALPILVLLFMLTWQKTQDRTANVLIVLWVFVVVSGVIAYNTANVLWAIWNLRASEKDARPGARENG